MRLTSDKQIPLKIQTCAHAHQLGVPRIIYASQQVSRLPFVLGPLAIGVCALILGAYSSLYDRIFSWWPLWQAWLVPGIGIAWFLIGLWILLPPLLFPIPRVFLCPRGLIYLRRNCEVVRWDQIVQLTKELQTDQKATSLAKYILLRADGFQLALENDLPHLDRLGGFMEREITRHLLPQMIAKYEAGALITFGSLEITGLGLWLSASQRLLSWSEFERLSLDDTSFSLYRRYEDRAWQTLSLSGFPNVWVCKGLIEHITKPVPIPVVEEPVAAPIRPAQCDLYDAGIAIPFGALTISREGIALQNNARFLPWETIASIGVGEQETIIKLIDSDEWHVLPIWSITDPAKLSQLIDYALYQHYFFEGSLS